MKHLSSYNLARNVVIQKYNSHNAHIPLRYYNLWLILNWECVFLGLLKPELKMANVISGLAGCFTFSFLSGSKSQNPLYETSTMILNFANKSL